MKITCLALFALLASGCTGTKCGSFERAGLAGEAALYYRASECADDKEYVINCPRSAEGRYVCTCSVSGTDGTTYSQLAPFPPMVGTDRGPIIEHTNAKCGWDLRD